jgi:hypothetical protein
MNINPGSFMKKHLAFFVLLLAVVIGGCTVPSTRKTVPSESAEPAGIRKATPTPTATPKSTPAKRAVRQKKSSTTSATATATPAAQKRAVKKQPTPAPPAPSQETPPAPTPTLEATPAPPPAPEAPATPPATSFEPPPAAQSEETTLGSVPAANTAQEARERAQYRSVRAKALENKQIQQLRDQMDAAGTDQQRKAAAKKYYNTLFEKMREIDPSLKDRINRMEAAAQRRMSRSRAGSAEE